MRRPRHKSESRPSRPMKRLRTTNHSSKNGNAQRRSWNANWKTSRRRRGVSRLVKTTVGARRDSAQTHPQRASCTPRGSTSPKRTLSLWRRHTVLEMNLVRSTSGSTADATILSSKGARSTSLNYEISVQARHLPPAKYCSYRPLIYRKGSRRRH